MYSILSQACRPGPRSYAAFIIGFVFTTHLFLLSQLTGKMFFCWAYENKNYELKRLAVQKLSWPAFGRKTGRKQGNPEKKVRVIEFFESD
jgi:hypothetical protein